MIYDHDATDSVLCSVRTGNNALGMGIVMACAQTIGVLLHCALGTMHCNMGALKKHRGLYLICLNASHYEEMWDKNVLINLFYNDVYAVLILNAV